MEKTTFTRKELYDLVWSIPMLQLAKKYNISDNGLRKICKRMNIPTPNGAYWTKLKYNKNVNKEKLPTNYSGKNEVNLTERDPEAELNESPISQKNKLIKSYLKLDQLFFQVSKKLTNPDKIVLSAQKALLLNKMTSYYQGPFIYAYGNELSIKVSSKNVNRALCFFDALIKLLHYRNHDIQIINSKTYAVIKDVKIELYLREKYRIESVMGKFYPSNEYFGTDIFIFKVDNWISIKEFTDSNKMLEERLPEILAELEYRAEKEIERRIIRDREDKIENERKLKEKEILERKEKEIKDFKNLLGLFKRWQKAQNLREYISAVEAKSKNEGYFSDEIVTWVNWAKQKADWYDPIVNYEDPILGYFKKKKLKDVKYK